MATQSMVLTGDVLADMRALAEFERPAWDEISAAIPGWHPRLEGDPDPEPDPEPTPDPEPDPDPDPDPDESDPDPDPAREPNWKTESRKHERRAKAEKKAREEAEAKLRQRSEADQTEQEKAVNAAKAAGRAEAEATYTAQIRSNRLEMATVRLAGKGIRVGEGDDQKTLKFADPEDAQVHLDAAIRSKDIDVDDLFDDDGKVQSGALTEALAELLENKPHLAATTNGAAGAGKSARTGSSDAGKGTASKDLEDLSPEEHLKQLQKR